MGLSESKKGPFERKYKKESQSKKKESILTVARKDISPGNTD
jgi:hypothetical protein